MRKTIVLLVTITLTLPFCAFSTGAHITGVQDQGPVIIIKAPGEGESLWVGERSGIHFVMDLESTVPLDSYGVRVNPVNGEGRQGDPFIFEKTWKIDGETKTRVHHHEITVPEGTMPGEYIFEVWCTDRNGNQEQTSRKVELAVFGL